MSGAGFLTIGVPAAVAIRLATIVCTLPLVPRARVARALALAGSLFPTVYRPTREVEARAEPSPYYPYEVRYRSAIEPTFERYVYGPVLRAVLRIVNGMKALQAGSLHAHLAYVLVLGVLLLIWLGGSK